MALDKFLSLIAEGTNKALTDVSSRIQEINDQLKTQNMWIDRASEAFKAGYYLESMVICINLINSRLRLAIYFDSVLKNANRYGIIIADNYLHTLMTDYANPLLGKIDDRKLYKEVLALRIIDKSLHSDLHALYDSRNENLHNLFSGKGEIKEIKDDERKLATRYLAVTIKCLEFALIKSQGVLSVCEEVSQKMGHSIDTQKSDQT